jgi:predicted alpha-1,6-mannanase (GH76 family)
MYTQRGEAALADASTARSEKIFEHVAERAWNASAAACGGGIWWSTQRSYKNAIANELFFATAAKLGKRSWAQKAWDWFEQSGMINNQSLINDGLGSDCRNNHATTYTYNQGVILGGLSQLHAMTRNASLLIQAGEIIDAVLEHLTDENGVLTEVDCGDGSLFKGIFVRYVAAVLIAHHTHHNMIPWALALLCSSPSGRNFVLFTAT